MIHVHYSYIVSSEMAVKKRKTATHGGARPGAGRPSLVKNPRSMRVNVEREDYEALQQIAEESDTTITELIRRAIRSFLRQRRR